MTSLAGIKGNKMSEKKRVRQPKPVAFVSCLCILMAVGEIYSGFAISMRKSYSVFSQNPFAIAYYLFLPVAFWMIVDQQRRNREEIHKLLARIEQLEGKGKT